MVWLPFFPIELGISSSQLTDHICQRGGPTTNQIWDVMHKWSYIHTYERWYGAASRFAPDHSGESMVSRLSARESQWQGRRCKRNGSGNSTWLKNHPSWQFLYISYLHISGWHILVGVNPPATKMISETKPHWRDVSLARLGAMGIWTFWTKPKMHWPRRLCVCAVCISQTIGTAFLALP